MPDTGFTLKRPQLPAFGAGTVKKRARNNVQEKNLDSHAANAKAILSGGNNDFRVKPVSLFGSAQRPARLPGLPLNQEEALATFQSTTDSNGPARSMQSVNGSRVPFPPAPDSNTGTREPQKKIGWNRDRLELLAFQARKQSNSTTLLTSRIRPPQLQRFSPNLTTPVRKVLPFHALPVPAPEESVGETSSASLKPLPLPKFDVFSKGKGKLMAMTALEPPTVELPEEKIADGEALELRRGLLVSPEKGERKRGRFIRNGLAERAQTLMNQSSTSLTLWKKEIETSTSRPGRLHADLRLRVEGIKHVSRNENVHSRGVGTLRSVLAVCRFPDGEERTVLFSFASESSVSHCAGTKESIVDGTEVLVWKPWQEIRVHPPALLCSRFVVIPRSS